MGMGVGLGSRLLGAGLAIAATYALAAATRPVAGSTLDSTGRSWDYRVFAMPKTDHFGRKIVGESWTLYQAGVGKRCGGEVRNDGRTVLLYPDQATLLAVASHDPEMWHVVNDPKTMLSLSELAAGKRYRVINGRLKGDF